MGRCKRRGYCCRDIRLAESPEMLERAYTFWKKLSSIDPSFSEIYLIYPMLVFRYEKPEEDLPYHYSCKHFTYDKNGVPTCSIYEIRPNMCRDFPYYDDIKYLDIEDPPSPYVGCGYNDPD